MSNTPAQTSGVRVERTRGRLTPVPPRAPWPDKTAPRELLWKGLLSGARHRSRIGLDPSYATGSQAPPPRTRLSGHGCWPELHRLVSPRSQSRLSDLEAFRDRPQHSASRQERERCLRPSFNGSGSAPRRNTWARLRRFLASRSRLPGLLERDTVALPHFPTHLAGHCPRRSSHAGRADLNGPRTSPQKARPRRPPAPFQGSGSVSR